MSYDGIIIGDKRIPTAAPVRTWLEHGIEFKAGEGYNKRRRQEIDLHVIHWTGGENKPETLAATLRRRKLGIEFSIYRGEVWQFCDPILVDTADAGHINPRSVGTEIINYGFRRRAADIPRAGRARPLYRCLLRGKYRTFAHFWPADIAAAIALSEALSTALPIPRCVPMSGSYMVAPRTLDPMELRAFKGHLGHFHISARKSDPGFDILEALRAVWAPDL